MGLGAWALMIAYIRESKKGFASKIIHTKRDLTVTREVKGHLEVMNPEQ